MGVHILYLLYRHDIVCIHITLELRKTDCHYYNNLPSSKNDDERNGTYWTIVFTGVHIVQGYKVYKVQTWYRTCPVCTYHSHGVEDDWFVLTNSHQSSKNDNEWNGTGPLYLLLYTNMLLGYVPRCLHTTHMELIKTELTLQTPIII